MRHEQLSFVVARWLARHIVIPLLVRMQVRGLEHVPRSGAFIAAANHSSMLDIPLMMALLPRRPSIMGRRDLWEKPLLPLMLNWGDAVPVNRGGADRAALRAAEDKLSKGIPFGIFPEGTRTRTGALGSAKAGVGMIALRAKVPVVPIAFIGTQNILRGRRLHFFPRPRVAMIIGPPIEPEELAQAGRPDAAAELIMRRIAALLPAEARGIYADLATAGSTSGQEDVSV